MFQTAMRLFVKKSKSRTPQITLNLPPLQISTITRTIHDIIRDNGPLSVGDIWDQVKEVGLLGLMSKNHMKVVLKYMMERKILNLVYTQLEAEKQFLYTTRFQSRKHLPKAACDAKFYGNIEIFNVLKSRGARAAKARKTPMAVSNPREVPEYELNPQELQVRKCDGISKGTYQVAKWNGTKVSVKILDKDSYSDLDRINAFKHELMLLEKVRHPNVVQFVGAVTQNVPMMIVSEYHPNGDLASYLFKKGRLSMKKVIKFSLDIARGMNYLHECKPDPVIHCDLKPKNILMDSGGQLKIAGFGLMTLSKISSDKAKLTNREALAILMSGPYVAPEIYKECEFDKSVDVFSFGVLLYELIEGVQPFHPKSPEEAAKLLCLEGKRPPFKSKVKNYPPDTKDLIEECWDPEPNLRPSFSIIITRLDKLVLSFSKHGWLKDTFRLPWYVFFTLLLVLHVCTTHNRSQVVARGLFLLLGGYMVQVRVRCDHPSAE